ncbi:hypothetical protein [Mycobacterium avium]|uniref:hypothetical protein n=1 Tax=Mycobacterium avium TaxID=1764 RepID=UPI00114FEDD2|nr:hypothetical protein [Mycobacterium avium]
MAVTVASNELSSLLALAMTARTAAMSTSAVSCTCGALTAGRAGPGCWVVISGANARAVAVVNARAVVG